MDTKTRKYLYNHTSPETAYVVDDYPWGFRLRTTIRYWIETKDAKNGGQRFVSQTKNPKTGQWCAPKKCTYSPIIILFLDENEHVKCQHLSHYSNEQQINEFKETHRDYLDDFQKKSLKYIIAGNQVMKHVKVTCEIVKEGESEQRKKDQEEAIKTINKAVAYQYTKVVL